MEFCSAPGRLYAEDANGVLLAEITFPTAGDGVANLNHTFVHPSLQGQGWRAGWCAPQQSSCALKAERPVFPAPTPLSGSGAIRSTAMCSSKTSRKKAALWLLFSCRSTKPSLQRPLCQRHRSQRQRRLGQNKVDDGGLHPGIHQYAQHCRHAQHRRACRHP